MKHNAPPPRNSWWPARLMSAMQSTCRVPRCHLLDGTNSQPLQCTGTQCIECNGLQGAHMQQLYLACGPQSAEGAINRAVVIIAEVQPTSVCCR